MATIEKESNKLADVKWTDTGKLEIKFVDGNTRLFDPSMVHSALHKDAEYYGWAVRFQRLGAVSATEFPTRDSRVQEYKRRVDERLTHLLNGAAEWDMPKRAAAPKVTRADIEEALTRAFPKFEGGVVFTRKLAELKGSSTGDDAPYEIETIKYWLSTKQVAKAWADIQAERRAAQTETFLDVEADLERLMGEAP